jgi:hypothetical protein
MRRLPLEVQLHIIDICLAHAFSDILYRRRIPGVRTSGRYISSVASIALISRLYWAYMSRHPDYARLRLFNFLNGLTHTVGECSLFIAHGAQVLDMKAWSSSVFDGIAHGDLFFVENPSQMAGYTSIHTISSHIVTRVIFFETLDLWARMNSYRVGVYLQKDVKHSESVDSDSVLRYGPQQRITRIRV